MVPYVIPGTVLGIGFITAFNEPPLRITVVLYTGATSTMPIATCSHVLAGAYGPAAAVASLLILATTISLVLFTLIGGNDDRLTV